MIDHGVGTSVLFPRFSDISSIPLVHTYRTPGCNTILISVQNDDELTGQASIDITMATVQEAAFQARPRGIATYGGIATLMATLASLGVLVQGRIVSFTLDHASSHRVVGFATIDEQGVATSSGVGLAGIDACTCGGYVGAEFSGDSTFGAAIATVSAR